MHLDALQVLLLSVLRSHLASLAGVARGVLWGVGTEVPSGRNTVGARHGVRGRSIEHVTSTDHHVAPEDARRCIRPLALQFYNRTQTECKALHLPNI
jgi:hypothetical protein